MFLFQPPSIYPLNLFVGQIAEKMSKIYLNVVRKPNFAVVHLVIEIPDLIRKVIVLEYFLILQ